MEPKQQSRGNATRGALLGAVIGDAFGSPLEGAGRAGLSLLVDRRRASPQFWGYTDDALMFVAVAEAVVESGTVEPDALLRAFVRHYEPARGFGRGMKLALQAYQAGTPWPEVAAAAWPDGSRGNGGAVRAGAVALRSWASRDDLLHAVTLATRVTHSTDEAIAAAVLHASLLAGVVEHGTSACSADGALDLLTESVPASFAATAMLAKVRSATIGDTADIASICGTSPFAAESVPAALASFIRAHDSYEHAITHAASLGGDVDSICAMVGALAGALHGADGIPSAWLRAVAHESPSPERLIALADALLGLPKARFDVQRRGE